MQSKACDHMGSPFMGRLLAILAARWDPNTALGRKMARFDGDLGPSGHSLPLRIAGALQALVLTEADRDLVAVYPPHDSDDAQLEQAVLNALKSHEGFILGWTDLPPQTNEVRRSAALIAMAHVALSYFDLPVVLSELGASGGLNLMWDHFALDIPGGHFGPENAALTLSPDWTGAAPPKGYPQVVDRSGVDLNPLNPKDPDDRLRLNAYLWADQPERLDMTCAATSVASAVVEKGDAINWLEKRLDAVPQGHMHIVQHTVAWQYFPAQVQARGTALLEGAGAQATAHSPLAWMQMEADGGVGAALTLRLWPGDVTLALGRADFHGRWVKWDAPTHP